MGAKSETVILPTHSPELFRTAVEQAAKVLRAGGLVALPTETVYGLSANALDAAAVSEIFKVKGRPPQNPIIVHVSNMEMAKRCAAQWPAMADALADAFWPGPLTMVVPRSKEIPDVVTAGGLTVGVRWPRHPFMQAVIQECGFPLAAPSANPSNAVSPTTAEHVRKQLGSKLSLIVDGGPSQVGIESTVVDLTAEPPRLLRPGMIDEAALMAVTGELSLGFGDSEQILKSPGLLRKHYAPHAPLMIWRWRDDADLMAQLAAQATDVSHCHVIAHSRVPTALGSARVCVIPHDPEAFARAIYSELHKCDELGAKLIVVEAPPERSEWRAIADRLKRAAA